MSRRNRAAALLPEPIADNGPTRRAGVLDREIGQRVRRHRTQKRISQEQLSELLGISCPQLQKYEAGTNRISASRLVSIAGALGVWPAELLSEDKVKIRQELMAVEVQGTEAIALITAFYKIQNAESRQKIVQMAQFLADLDRSTRS